ncbi:MAG: alpha/beta hydrolase-fold protein [Acidobacteriota bacterium]
MVLSNMKKTSIAIVAALIVLIFSAGLHAQAKKPAYSRGPTVTSPEVLPDGSVAFRILAPEATSVGLSASDIPGLARGGPQFTKDESGIWETTVGPIPPGAYRYVFTVDGANVVDPRNTAISESNNNVWSMVYIPGARFMDMLEVPHGAVSEVYYYSEPLALYRRMHVYTPPGYMLNSEKYPVFYLLHGAGDCDDSWTTVGRAGFILDNLIAAGKVKPMIVVMPAGHVPAGDTSGGAGMSGMVDAFSEDFVKGISPYVEANYRVLEGRKNRAIAGLSMGGMQTLNIAMDDLARFSYIGVFSSGVFGMSAKPAPKGAEAKPAAKSTSPDWEEQHLSMLDNEDLKKDLKLLWFATGSEDFLVGTTQATVDMFKKHGFSPVYKKSGGGHTWINWREYLEEFAPKLFQ